MQNMKAPDDLFSILLARLGMKPNELPPELRTQVDGLVEALHDRQWSVRVAAVQALGKLEGQVPRTSLIAALADEHEAVRATAVRTLGTLGELAPVDSLVYALGDPSWMVRADAVYALGKLGARVPMQTLVDMMKDEDTTVRAATIQALGKMGERAPIDPLVSALDDQEWLVREAAVLALGKMGERVPIASLMKATYDKDETVREAAMITLQQIHLAAISENRPAPIPHHPVSIETFPRIPSSRPQLRARRRLPQRPVLIGFAALAVASLILASLAIFQRSLPANGGQVGYVSFMSSQDNSTDNSAIGYNDEVQIDLHNLRPPAPGKSYYAWLLSDINNPEGIPLLLGMLPVTNGNARILYQGDIHHSNLLAVTSRFLITEEDTSIPPLSPSLDTHVWIYYGEISQKPDPTDTVNHYSLLDYLRYLLATDPTLEAQGLHGGVTVWLKRNAAQVLGLVQQMQDARDKQDVQSERNQLISILDYLDGQDYIQGDVPPGTPWLIDQASARIPLLELDPLQQNPPGYLYHIKTHLTAIAANPYATPNQKTSATHIIDALNKMEARLEQMRADAKRLITLTDAQLLQTASSATFDDIVVQVTTAYNGQFDARTKKVLQEGIVQVHQDIQRLATFEVSAYQQ